MKYIALCIALLLICGGCSIAADGGGRVVLVVAANISVRDLTAPGLPNLTALFDTGSGALMNVHTGRAGKEILPIEVPGMEAGCVTLGASAMAIGGMEVWHAANASAQINGIPAASLYSFRTGKKPGSAEVIHTEISRIIKVNASASYHAVPGGLGSALQAAGIKTAIIGNSDIPGQMHREAVAAVMSREGRVDFGDVGSTFVTTDKTAPYGIRTDPAALMQAFEKVLSKSRFIVVDFGDTYRADMAAESCTDDRAALVRHQAALRLDKFIATLSSKLDLKKDTLILLSPSSRNWTDLEEERLAPILIAGPGFEKGTLSSPSTRKAGLVTLNDVAPTVLGIFGIKSPVDMVGRKIYSRSGPNSTENLLKLNIFASLQQQRLVAMRGVSVAQSVIVALVTCALLFGVGGVLRKVCGWLAVVPAILPIAMLSLPLIYLGGLVGTIITLVLLTAAILGLCIALFKTPLRALVWLFGAIVSILTVDLLLGSPLTSSSIAGYSIIEGARYYGIGNELMGTMIGAMLLGLGLAFAQSRLGARVRTLIILAVFATVFLVIALPPLGAKVGGAIAIVPAMGIALLARKGWRPNVHGLALVALMTVVILGTLFAIDAMRSGASQSHMGRLIGQAAGGDSSGVLQLMERKFSLNMLLVVTSLWSRLLGLSVVGTLILSIWGKNHVGGKMLSKEESAMAMATCFAAAGAFAFNDSGVLAAATCMVLLWSFMASRVMNPFGGKTRKPR